MVDAVVAERRLPIVEAPVALCTPRVAVLLVEVWDRAVVPALRASAEPVPADLGDFVEACRELARARPPVRGTRGIPPEGESANLREMTTSEVAALLACSARNVRGLRSRGRLLARRHPRKGWLFDPVDVAAYIERRAESA